MESQERLDLPNKTLICKKSVALSIITND